MSQKQRTSVVGRAVRLALALLLAITLFPATSLNAFADELDTVEIEAVGQELGAETDELEAEASQSAITIEPSLPEALASVDDEPVDIEQSAQEVPAPHTLEAMGVTVNNIDIVPLSTSAEIVIEARESGQVTIANKWTTDIIVTQDGLPGLPVNSGSLTTLPVTQGDRISVTEENPDATFRQWRDWIYPFVSGVECAIVSMPAMSSFTVNSAGTIAGNNFFKNFNSSGPLISNGYGSLTSLPAGSFDTSNITTTGNSFFNSFNMSGSLTSLPAGSFNTSNITTTGDYFFQNFNAWGSLTSLPAGSFGTSRITTTENNFFTRFNNSGRLTSLPTGSFNTSNITTAGNAFFNDFNASGSLTSLPAGSFNTSNITTTGNAFFNGFNASGSLTSLPTGSFNTSNITTTGNAFFWSFNNRGRLTSLPTGSFNTSGITTGEFGFFRSFNYGGSLTSLPAGSFDTSGITTAGEDFFFVFNYGGSLTSLPASFRLPQSLSSVGAQYCGSMFADSALTKGNQSIPLYFAVASSETFSGTNIAPVNPGAGVTVWVNGGGTIPNRNVTFNLNGGSASWGTGNRTISVQQGALIPAQTATRTGYTLAGWNEGTTRWNFASHTVPARNITLVAQWKPNTNTAYKVEHYKVSSTGKVTLAATQNLKGTTAAKVTAQVRSFTGFTQDTKHRLRVASGTISANGTLVLKLYYKVNSYTITYAPNGGAGTSVKQTVYYGESFKVRAASTFKRPGYTFVSWNTQAKGGGTTFSAGTTRTYNTVGNTTLRAQWKQTGTLALSYQTHVQTVGWQAFKKEGEMSGTSGRALRLEGIILSLQNTTGISGGIKYATHIQSIGWQKPASLWTSGGSTPDLLLGSMSGTSGRALRLEAITIELTGDLKKHYDIYYRVHAQSVGWMGWAKNGQEAGTAGHAYRLEGIQILLVPKAGGKAPGNVYKGITTPPGTPKFIKK